MFTNYTQYITIRLQYKKCGLDHWTFPIQVLLLKVVKLTLKLVLGELKLCFD